MSKKLLSCFLMLTFLLTCLSFHVTVSAVDSGVLITSSDDFSGDTVDTTKWTIAPSNSSVVVLSKYPDETDSCLTLTKADNSRRDLPQFATILAVDPKNPAHALDENDVVEVKAKLATRNVRGGARMEVFSDNEKSIASIVLGPSTGEPYANNYPAGISIHTGDYLEVTTPAPVATITTIDKTAFNLLPGYNLSTATSATFYEVKLVLNFRTKKIDVYIDGVKRGSGIDFRSDAAGATNVGNVTFSTDRYGTGDAASGDCNFYVDDFQASIYDEVVEDPSTPSVSELSLIGNAAVGSTLLAKYEYFCSAAEGDTQYDWMICDNLEGDYTKLDDQAGKTVTVTPELLGKYIQVTVTPKSVDGKSGEAKTSAVKLVFPSGNSTGPQYEYTDASQTPVTIYKTDANPRSSTAKAIAAVYNSNNQLNKIAMYDIPADLEYTQSTTIDYSDLEVANNETTKVFIFDAMSNLKPIAIENTNMQTSHRLTMPSYFNDNMVLQQGESVAVWGKYKPFYNVTVSFAGQTKTAKADANGDWSVALDPLEASSINRELVISTITDCIIYKNILVGEVWLLSGQSNAEMDMTYFTTQTAQTNTEVIDKINADIASANYPLIRYAKTAYSDLRATTTPPMRDEYSAEMEMKWQAVSPDNAGAISAMGFYYAKALYESLQVPVGIINSAKAGKAIQEFIPDKEVSATDGTYVSNGIVYNELIAPYLKHTFKGIVWYQGESDITYTDHYIPFFKRMTEIYRRNFNKPDMPFYYVQVAPRNFEGKSHENIIEAQRQLLDNVENCYMAIINDLGDSAKPNNVHPPYKDIVGERLVKLALHYTYGQPDEAPCGPLYKSHTIEGNTIKIKFDYVGSGLKIKNSDTLEGFVIAGDDGEYYPAIATITAPDEVSVTASEVENPKNVRYLYTQWPNPITLYNSEDLPASSFTTDIIFNTQL